MVTAERQLHDLGRSCVCVCVCVCAYRRHVKSGTNISLDIQQILCL